MPPTRILSSVQRHSRVVALGSAAALGVQEGGAAVGRHQELAAEAVDGALQVGQPCTAIAPGPALSCRAL